jgi:hypothetical protein
MGEGERDKRGSIIDGIGRKNSKRDKAGAVWCAILSLIVVAIFLPWRRIREDNPVKPFPGLFF